MSLVSTVSQPLMDKCEDERNPILLAAVKLLGDAHLKCCIQMYYSLALITKVVSELLSDLLRNPTKAPDTENRQYALMQKIMMPAKLWCDHAEGFESGLRAWELDVGEWERASGTALADAVKYTVMMNLAQIFLRNGLQLGYIRQQCCYSNSFVAMVLLFPKLWSESDRVSWKWNERR